MTNVSQPRREPGLTQTAGGKWRVKVSAVDPATGARVQRLGTFPTKAAAKKWRVETLAAIAQNAYIAPTSTSFDSLADAWLEMKASDVRKVTYDGYVNALRRARIAFGSTKVQRLTEQQVQKLAQGMADEGMAAGSIRITLFCVRSVLARAVKARHVPTNVAQDVKVPKRAKPPVVRAHLPTEDAAKLAAIIVGDRLEGLWLLTLCGLRRSEAMAVQWSDVDLDAGELTIARGRVELHRGGTDTNEPKSARSRRTLPLPAPVLAGLRRTRAIRAQERMALGLGWDDSALLASDVTQSAIRPQHYSDMWAALLASAGVPHVTLHGARHGSVSRMLDSGVPVHIVASWHGHDPSMTLSTYAHSSREGKAAAGEASFAFGVQA